MIHHVIRTKAGKYVSHGTSMGNLANARVYPSKRAASSSLTNINKQWRHKNHPLEAEVVPVRIVEVLETISWRDMIEEEPYFFVKTGTENVDRTKFYYRRGDGFYNQDGHICPVSNSDRFVP